MQSRRRDDERQPKKNYIYSKTGLLTKAVADYSNSSMKELRAMEVQEASPVRTGGVPNRGSQTKKFLTRSIWLGNNKLKSMKNLESIVDSVIDMPSQLSWIDFSFNNLKEIDDCVLNYPNLRLLYFHGNKISDLKELCKLRKLKYLSGVTFHGNPIAELASYRANVNYILPNITNLDFKSFTPNDKCMPPSPETVKLMREFNKETPVKKED